MFKTISWTKHMGRVGPNSALAFFKIHDLRSTHSGYEVLCVVHLNTKADIHLIGRRLKRLTYEVQNGTRSTQFKRSDTRSIGGCIDSFRRNKIGLERGLRLLRILHDCAVAQRCNRTPEQLDRHRAGNTLWHQSRRYRRLCVSRQNVLSPNGFIKTWTGDSSRLSTPLRKGARL